MAKKKSKEPLTVEKIADMSVEDILGELLFQSFFTTERGPVCKCLTTTLTHFLGMIPDKMCGQCLDNVDLDTVPEFQTQVSSLCPCQLSHFFRLRLEKKELSYETIEGKNMDSRKLRLPNF